MVKVAVPGNAGQILKGIFVDVGGILVAEAAAGKATPVEAAPSIGDDDRRCRRVDWRLDRKIGCIAYGRVTMPSSNAASAIRFIGAPKWRSAKLSWARGRRIV